MTEAQRSVTTDEEQAAQVIDDLTQGSMQSFDKRRKCSDMMSLRVRIGDDGATVSSQH